MSFDRTKQCPSCGLDRDKLEKMAVRDPSSGEHFMCPMCGDILVDNGGKIGLGLCSDPFGHCSDKDKVWSAGRTSQLKQGREKEEQS